MSSGETFAALLAHVRLLLAVYKFMGLQLGVRLEGFLANLAFVGSLVALHD